VLYCFFSHLKADVLAQRQDLQADELLAEVLSEALAHAAEQLDCHDAVVLVLIIMGHLDDVLEHEVPAILVVEFMCEAPEFLAGLFLDLSEKGSTSRRLELRKKLSTGMRRFLMLSSRLSSFYSWRAISPIFSRSVRAISSLSLICVGWAVLFC
jgi:hypothetical protein